MDIVVTTESRFGIDAAGEPTCADGTYGYSFWQRYLTVFDRVYVIARQTTQAHGDGQRVTGPGVEVIGLPDDSGIMGMYRQWPTWRAIVSEQLRDNRAYLLRLPGMIGTLLEPLLHAEGRRYGVELVGDPFTSLAATATRAGMRGRGWQLMRWGARHALRQICRRAAAVAYVTSDYLQRRYPPGPDTITSTYSSIQLPDEAFAAEPRSFTARTEPWRFISVGTMSQPYKGQQILLEAFAQCQMQGLRAHLTLVGDGVQRQALARQVARWQLEKVVTFAGQVPQGPAVRAWLDQSDLFVLPSLSEGLPRAMIEAQARGLPCIGTRVGGVPELLDRSEIVPPGDPAALARMLTTLTSDPQRMSRIAASHWQKARSFASQTLQSRRTAFYRYLESISGHAWAERDLARAT